MNVVDLEDLRTRAKLSQADMAELLGMAPRSYQALERGETTLSLRHRLAAERASLRLAVFHKDSSLALPTVRRDALDFAALMQGEGREPSLAPVWARKHAQ